MSNCRFCDGITEYKFSKLILRKYHVKYYRCVICESLQCENPYWLSEAYLDNHISLTDTGIMQRNIDNVAIVKRLCALLNISTCVDFGGGEGIFCRLLSDYGVNCILEDQYAEPKMFPKKLNATYVNPVLLTAFEVFEHFELPLNQASAILSRQVDYLLISTDLYNNQSDDWWYLSEDTGQHVFFWSKKSLEMLASNNNYKILTVGSRHFLYRKLSPVNIKLIRFLLWPRLTRLYRIILMLNRANGVQRDHQKLKE